MKKSRNKKCGNMNNSILFIFIHQCLYIPLLGPGFFFSFVIFFFTQTVGLIGRVISSSQRRCLRTGQHKYRINAHTDIHAFELARSHDPSFRASEYGSCPRRPGHRDRRAILSIYLSTKCQAPKMLLMN
jgi:hypothetical protein